MQRADAAARALANALRDANCSSCVARMPTENVLQLLNVQFKLRRRKLRFEYSQRDSCAPETSPAPALMEPAARVSNDDADGRGWREAEPDLGGEVEGRKCRDDRAPTPAAAARATSPQRACAQATAPPIARNPAAACRPASSSSASRQMRRQIRKPTPARGSPRSSGTAAVRIRRPISPTACVPRFPCFDLRRFGDDDLLCLLRPPHRQCAQTETIGERVNGAAIAI